MASQKSDFERSVEDAGARRLFVQERTILELTEAVCREMQRQGVTRSELARRMGKTKGHVSQLLSGGRNLTLRSLSDMLLALGRSLEPITRRVDSAPSGYLRVLGGEDDGWKRDRIHVVADRENRFGGTVLMLRSTRGAA